MSYRAARSRRGLGEAAGITVGAAAFSNPILARSSLDASKIILALAQAPAADRPTVLRRKLDELQPGLGPEVARRFHGNIQDRSQDQALFDAIRGTLATRVVARGAQYIRNQVGNKYGWDTMLDTPLGDLAPNDKAIGCGIASGAATAGGITSLVPVYGPIASGVLGFGSQIASGAMDCTKEERDAQAALAVTQAAAAQANLQAAATAAADASAARHKLLVYGGGILGVTAVVYFLVS